MAHSKTDVVHLIGRLYKPQKSKYDLEKTILRRAYSDAELDFLHKSLTRQLSEDYATVERIISVEIAQGSWYGDLGWTDTQVTRALYSEFNLDIQNHLRRNDLTVSPDQACGIIEGICKTMREEKTA